MSLDIYDDEKKVERWDEIEKSASKIELFHNCDLSSALCAIHLELKYWNHELVRASTYLISTKSRKSTTQRKKYEIRVGLMERLTTQNENEFIHQMKEDI